MTVSSELARQAREMSFEDLPSDVVHEAKRRLMDTLGCALGGYLGASSQAIVRMVRVLGGAPEATVIGSGFRTSCASAALANGVMVRYTEFMDEGFAKSAGVWVRAWSHPGEVIPGILAVGERQHSTGKDVITATVLGYELLNKWGEIFNKWGDGFRETGWANETGVHFVIPLVIGKLLGLDEKQMVDAVGIAGSFAGVLKAVDDPNEQRPMARDLRFSFPAYQGIICALMAQEGFTGPTTILESPFGYADVIARNRNGLSKLTDTDRPSFSILNTGTKRYACFGRMIGSVDATLKLVNEHDIRPEQVARVKIRTEPIAVEAATVDRHAHTKQAADHSFYHVISVAIVDRAVTVEQFSPEKLNDPQVKDLSNKIEYAIDPELPQLFSAGAVEITTLNGDTYTCQVDVPKGKPSNPMSDPEVEEKFRMMATKLLDDQQVRDCVNTIWNLEKISDVGQLADLLVPRHR